MKTQPLSNKQQKSLNSMLLWRMIFCIIALIMIVFISYLVVEYSNKLDKSQFLLINLFSLIAISLFYYFFTKGLRKDLYGGIVDLIEYRLDDKITFEDDDPGIGKDGLSSPYIKYRFTSGGFQFSVRKELYNEVEITDIFLVPTTPNQKIEFDPIGKNEIKPGSNSRYN